MTEIDTDDTAALARRVRVLEEENARLSAGTIRPAGESRWTRSRWRAFLSALCIVIAAILVPVSIASAWTRVQLVDENAFVATLAPLADDPSVQALVVDQAMNAITEKVDFTQVTGNLFDGIAGLGMPDRAMSALNLLRAPAAEGLQNLVQTAVTRVVQSDAFSTVWTGALRSAHRALATTATSDGAGVVVLTDQGLGIQLGPIIDQVKQRLTDNGVGIAALIPSVNRTVIVSTGEAVTTIRTTYTLAVVAGGWLPFIALGFFVGGILLARRRTVAVVGSGTGLALGAGFLAASISAGAVGVSIAAGQLSLSPSALGVIYQSLVDEMANTAVVLAVLGVFIAVLGWVAGRGRTARRVRGLVGGINTSARTALAHRGLDTGRFGRWMGRQRVLVRSLVIVLAVACLLVLRPLSIGDVVLVVVLAVLAAWVLELLQQRPGEGMAEHPSADLEAAEFGTEDAETPDLETAEDDADAAATLELPDMGR